MKAGMFVRRAAATAVIFLGSTEVALAEGYFRLQSNDIMIATNAAHQIPGASSFRVELSRLESFVDIVSAYPLVPQTSLQRDPTKGVVHPVLVEVKDKEPGDQVRIHAEIRDGESLAATSAEALVVLGTRAAPGLLAEPLKFSELQGFDTNFPHYLDRTVFTPQFRRTGRTNDLDIRGNHVQAADRKVIVTGNFTEVNGSPQPGIVRLNTNGTTDPSFTSALPDGAVVTGSELLPSGSILLMGSFTVATSPNTNHVHRMIQVNTNGAFELSFTGPISNDVTAVHLQADGKILVAVTDPVRLIRLRPEGFLDGDNWASPTFEGETNATIHAISSREGGVIWIGGEFQRVNGVETGNFAQLKADGSLDTAPARIEGTVYAIEGNLVGGTFNNINGSPCKYIARITGTNVACGNDAVGERPLNLPPVDDILGEGRILVSPAGDQGRFVTGVNPFRRFGLSKMAVALSSSELYMAPVAFPLAQVARFVPTPAYSDNRLSQVDLYDEFLLLRPRYAWTEEFEYSDDLVTWHLNPEGIRDTNTSQRTRFYRIKPRQ